jgi:hypothetical protein
VGARARAREREKKGIVGGGEDGRWRLGVEEMERE